MVQTDQCIHTYYYPTPLILHRFCSFYKFTSLEEEEHELYQGLQFLGSQAVLKAMLYTCQSHGISTHPNVVRQLLFYFSQQLMSNLNQWLLSWPERDGIVERLSSHWAPHWSSHSSGWRKGGNTVAWTHFAPANFGAGGYLTFRWPRTHRTLTILHETFSFQAQHETRQWFSFRLLAPRSLISS